MEIERKYFIESLPFDPGQYPYHQIEQAYLCTEPVVRIRREDDTFYLTYKSKGKMVREEYNLPLTEKAYAHLLKKADGKILSKRRYLIPIPDRGGCKLIYPAFLVYQRRHLFRGIPEQQALIHLIRLPSPGSWDFVIAYRKDSYLSSAARNFIDITKNAFAGPPDEA